MRTSLARMTRRGMLVGAAAVAAWAVVKPPRLPAEPPTLDPTPTQRLLGIFRDPTAAAAIGRAYLRDQPQERDRDHLIALLMADARSLGGGTDGGATAGTTASAPHLHDRLRRQTRGDFAAGRTVWVDGVLLARTEARLYALAALA